MSALRYRRRPVMTAPASSLTAVPVTVPLALLPVRLETRYQAGPPPPGTTTPTWHLLVRVFPDQLHRNAHQPALTVDEVAARDDFDAQGGYGSDPHAPAAAAAWARLAQRYGPGRAAWIVATGLPGGTDLPPRDAAWTEPTWASCLPDKW